MLCSLASPCFLMWVSKGGQYKTRGNVITFSQDIARLCTTLPRLPEELDVLIVRKAAAREPSTYKDFRVRKKKVLDFLRFLVQHNPLYANISICPACDVDLRLLILRPQARKLVEDGPWYRSRIALTVSRSWARTSLDSLPHLKCSVRPSGHFARLSAHQMPRRSLCL